MWEWGFLSVLLLVLLAALARRGAHRLGQGRVPAFFMAAGFVGGVVLEAMPFARISAPFSVRTALAGLIGVFGMRLIARGVHAWGLGYRSEERGEPIERARLLHPLIALGLLFSGVVILHEACAARHLALEVERAPRDSETGILRGAEERNTPAADGVGHAVLLVHGMLGSRADFGTLPDALRGAGLGVHEMLLPGHGTTPMELRATVAAEWRRAVLAAYDALAAENEHVSIVGFSLGGVLTALAATERPVHRVVLVNPYAGVSGTPSWSPIETDTLIDFMAPISRYVMRARPFMMVQKEGAVDRLVAYVTVPVATALEMRTLVDELEADDRLAQIEAPTLLLLSEHDNAAPSSVGRALYGPLAQSLGDDFATHTFTASDHIVFLDHDEDEAVRRTLEWLTRE